MKNYRDFYEITYDEISGRENTEWSNMWWDKANTPTERRFLLVGDSTARMVRSTLAKIMGAPVDMIGSSSCVDDILFVSQVDAFFSTKQYHYDAVFLQVGHHGWVAKNGGPFTEKDVKQFIYGVNSLITFLSQYTSNIIIESIFYSVAKRSKPIERFLFRFKAYGRFATFLMRAGLRKEKSDDKINRITELKNEALYNIATDRNLKWLDISSLVKERKYAHIDHIHYAHNAKKFIVVEMIKMI